MSDETIYGNLTQLGGKSELPDSPDEARLEKVRNPQADVDYNVRFTAPEFTSLCPMTGQPDFAHLVIDYVPGQWLVESKSRGYSDRRVLPDRADAGRRVDSRSGRAALSWPGVAVGDDLPLSETNGRIQMSGESWPRPNGAGPVGGK